MTIDLRGSRAVWLAGAAGCVLALSLATPASALYDVAARWQPAVEHVQQGSNAVTISTVSTRNDMVTGGNVLVRIDGSVNGLSVKVNGADATASFQAMDGGLSGLVEGLDLGDNLIEVTGPNGLSASLTVTNYPITGPVFAGPQEQPFICQTDAFEISEGVTLGAPIDDDCSVVTRVDYFYRSGNEFKPLPDPTQRPADLATTTTSTGATVPYIVRVETGTINRSIYNIAMLHDPASDGEPSPTNPPAGWNDRLVYFYGGGCLGGYYRQGNGNTSAVLQDGWLREGYAAVHSTLNVAGNNCNTMLSAEVSLMVKEHFIEQFGAPLFTIGTGSSGGSYQTQAIVTSYPGILDGIIIGSVFADVTTVTLFTLADARLLYHYFNETNDPRTYYPWQQAAISGFLAEGNIEFLGTTGGALRIDPTESFHASIPAELRYDPVNNPGGARSTVYDHTVNVYGASDDGFAYRPLDNVGVQYGLAALNAGQIDKNMFLDLNANIGGFDLDLNYVPERHEADLSAIEAAYRTGLIIDGAGGYSTTPVIDYRSYNDDPRDGNIHHLNHGFATRARLQAANGDSYNHVMWVGGTNNYSANGQLTEAFRQMDAWLTAIVSDRSAIPLYDKVRNHRPADLVDTCWSAGPGPGIRIEETQVYQGTGICSSLYYPAGSSPRQVAGTGVANDVVKCQLKPLDRSDYNVTFSNEEWAQLQEIFPGGVCDWTKPGVAQVPVETWLRYTGANTQVMTR
ncbi:MAG: hypothetical protein IT535_12855 [Bauldia sp.]|nr:hypothetical protein [Bauldia sp.]